MSALVFTCLVVETLFVVVAFGVNFARLAGFTVERPRITPAIQSSAGRGFAALVCMVPLAVVVARAWGVL